MNELISDEGVYRTVSSTPALHVRLLVAKCADECGQTKIHTDCKTDRLAERHTDRQTDRLTYRQYLFLSQNWFVPPLLGQSY